MKTLIFIISLWFSISIQAAQVSESKSFVLSANDATGLDIQINAGEKITIQASGSIHTNINGNVSNCDIYTTGVDLLSDKVNEKHQ